MNNIDDVIRQQKQVLRKSVKKNRLEIPDSVYQERSAAIVHHLKSLDFLHAGITLHAFLPILRKREPDISAVFPYWSENGVRIAVPETESSHFDLLHLQYLPGEPLSEDAWGVSVPQNKRYIFRNELDVILVPLLAADYEGHRLGYGKGFYDRFLASSAIPAIGVCYSDEVFETIPYESHDVKIAGLVTDLGYQHF